MTQFDDFDLPAALGKSLNAMQFQNPTPIQEQAIPVALEGHDILGSAQTGTGKTAAFSIPLVARLLKNPQETALVLTPTRELASQVQQVIRQLLGNSTTIKTALLIGGDSMFKQLQQLKLRPRIIVGTPGRINDHLARGTLKLSEAKMLVLDETDRMLDMGFGVQLEKILKFLPQERQTLMFSATLPKEIVKMSERYLTNPRRIAVGSTHTPSQDIEQEIVRTTEAAKYDELVKQLQKREGSIIVFVKTKYGTEKLAKRLSGNNHSADAVHGDLQQRKRERVIAAFRKRDYRILVATDVAARGLDIPHIEHVINYDLPQCPEDFIHRIGRTARAGAKGAAASLITHEDGRKWQAIQRMLNPQEARPQRDGESQGGGNRSRGGYSQGQGQSRRDEQRPPRRADWHEGDRQANGRRPAGKSSEGRYAPRTQENGVKEYSPRKYEGQGEKRPSDFKGARDAKTYAPRVQDGQGEKHYSERRPEGRPAERQAPRGQEGGAKYYSPRKYEEQGEKRTSERDRNERGQNAGRGFDKAGGNGGQKPFRLKQKDFKPQGGKKPNPRRNAA